MVKTNSDAKMTTKCVHAGAEPEPIHGSINVPVHFTTTFVQPDVAMPKTHDYTRGGNPTRDALEAAVAELEGASRALVFSSGLSAMDAVIRLMKNGDHVVCAEDAYGGTIRILRQIASRQGIATTFVDTRDLEAVKAALTPETKWLFMETPTNPLLRVSDIQAVADVAHANGSKLLVDSTFMTPILQNPLELGADVVMHSATKGIGGHTDVLAGLLATKDDKLAEELYFIQMAVGAVLPPMDCYLLLRGIKTLALRMERQSSNAQTLAERLADKVGNDNVFYPGLASHDGHAIHAAQSSGGGSMLSFRTEDAQSARNVATSTKLWQLAESLGAVESLIQVPAAMTHAGVPKEMREHTGLTDGIIRLSVGIEDVDELWADLETALDSR
jgi:cystathionine gamma-lyase/homocysteine desulfhydrase